MAFSRFVMLRDPPGGNSAVPMGLLHVLSPNPGTEVPGYCHGVPPGRITLVAPGIVAFGTRCFLGYRQSRVRDASRRSLSAERPVRDAMRIALHFSAGIFASLHHESCRVPAETC